MYYGDLKAWNNYVSRVFPQFMTELEYKKAVESYTKRWQRFYGLNNKYDGKGNLR